MTSSKAVPRVDPPQAPAKHAKSSKVPAKELVIVTGISGAGKASALKAFEDLGFHAVDNLPLELLPDFARLIRKAAEVERAAIVVDVREGPTLDRLPEILKNVKKLLPTRVVFLDAQDAVLVRRYSETRRPHPLGKSETVARSIVEERQLLDPIRNVADTLIDTSNFNVHELRANMQNRFGHEGEVRQLLVSCLSFGFKNGVPLDADMVFDVRKSYLTVAFGCTGGQHRSVMMAEEMAQELQRAGYHVKALHRDIPRHASAPVAHEVTKSES